MEVETNLKLVYKVYHKNFEGHRDKEDLIQEGSIGLIKACRTWDGKRVFSTYAYKCIKNEMLLYLRKRRKDTREVFSSDLEREAGTYEIKFNSIDLGDYTDIGRLLAMGYSQMEIAQMKHKSKSAICKDVKRIREICKERRV